MTRDQFASGLVLLLFGACAPVHSDAGESTAGSTTAAGIAGSPAEVPGGTAGTAPGVASGGFGGTSGAVSQPAQCGVGGSTRDQLGGLQTLEPEPTEPQACSRPGQTPSPFEPTDQCACNDLVCSNGKSCRRVIQPARNAVGGPDVLFNGCFALCISDSDCDAPTVCVRNLYGLDVCAEVGCRRQADCSADACGTCDPGYFNGHSGVVYDDPSQSKCLYSGPCGVTSCTGCENYGDTAHTCG